MSGSRYEERCTCGAWMRADGPTTSAARELIREWRRDHQHEHPDPEPPTRGHTGYLTDARRPTGYAIPDGYGDSL